LAPQVLRVEKDDVKDGMTYYFIDNEYYFARSGLYGFLDEAERFAFFSSAALACLPYLEATPQILHCHDWQTGLISVFLKSHYKDDSFYRSLKTVLTIHNLHYRGTFPAEVMGDVLGLGEEFFNFEGLEFYGQVSYLKGGLVFSDILTTVSKTYAREIQTPEFGEKMEGVLQQRKDDLYGILNGIDYREYGALMGAGEKQQSKEALQKFLGLPVAPEVPVFAVVSRLVKQKVDILARALTRLLALDLQLVVLGTGDDRYAGYFQHYAKQFRNKMSARLLFDEELARKIYAGSDIFLMPSLFEPCGLSQLIAMRYGSIPVVRETGGLKDTVRDYDPETGAGTGFSFSSEDSRDLLDTAKRALAVYQDKKAWSKLVQNAVQADFSWSNSAGEYISLYRGLLAKKRGK
jgi:starch synthase